MAYKKQNFKDGNKLTASMLNHIEAGIVSLEKALTKQKVKKLISLKIMDALLAES